VVDILTIRQYSYMMWRIQLSEAIAQSYFTEFEKKLGKSPEEIIQIFDISVRTYRDWKKGRHKFPQVVANYIEKSCDIKVPRKAIFVNEKIWRSIIGEVGGRASYNKYGCPATPEGRSKGGRNSLKTHELLQTGFRTPKLFPNPRNNEQLAEFLGIMLGDGNVSQDQIKIYINKDEKDYIVHIINLMTDLFQERPSVYERKTENVSTIYLSGKNLVNILTLKGLKIGNKIRN